MAVCAALLMAGPEGQAHGTGFDAERDDVSAPGLEVPRLAEQSAQSVLPELAGPRTNPSEPDSTRTRTPFDGDVIETHRGNYLLPVAYTTRLNEQVYEENEVSLRSGLRAEEVKFQISLKAPVNEKDLVFKGGRVFLALTIEAWWQLYSWDVSSPFRETDYQPEVFYSLPGLWSPFEGQSSLLFGLAHESNGQVQGLSRSWNRLYLGLQYKRGPLSMLLRPWYRLPEKTKPDPDSAEGDDNPDIIDFMGHGDLRVGWHAGEREWFVDIRSNTATGKGAIELGVTFPLLARFRGFIQYFNGYGESLIDYNHFQQRLGLGVALSGFD